MFRICCCRWIFEQPNLSRMTHDAWRNKMPFMFEMFDCLHKTQSNYEWLLLLLFSRAAILLYLCYIRISKRINYFITSNIECWMRWRKDWFERFKRKMFDSNQMKRCETMLFWNLYHETHFGPSKFSVIWVIMGSFIPNHVSALKLLSISKKTCQSFIKKFRSSRSKIIIYQSTYRFSYRATFTQIKKDTNWARVQAFSPRA